MLLLVSQDSGFIQRCWLFLKIRYARPAGAGAGGAGGGGQAVVAAGTGQGPGGGRGRQGMPVLYDVGGSGEAGGGGVHVGGSGGGGGLRGGSATADGSRSHEMLDVRHVSCCGRHAKQGGWGWWRSVY